MDKEAQIAKIKKIFETYSLELDDSGQDLIENDGFYYEYARRIYHAGYRKLPQEKPPLVYDARKLTSELKVFGDLNESVADLIEAQREADIKHYESTEKPLFSAGFVDEG